MRVIERSFSDLLRRPKAVVEDLEDGDVLLRRRDEPDLRLTLADREAARLSAFATLGRALRNMAVHNPEALADFRYATHEAAHGWEAVGPVTPGNARAAWERIATDPRQRTERQHPLKGSLGTRCVNGEMLEQWQYEVTGGGRLWYCIDDERHL